MLGIMRADRTSADLATAERLAAFVVRPDGTVVGDDGTGGRLAAALPYTGRLARRVGGLVGCGDLRSIEAVGPTRLAVGITWTPAGAGTYRGVVTDEPPRVLPGALALGRVDTASSPTRCASLIAGVPGVTWSSIVTAGSRVVAAVGESEEQAHLAEVGTRLIAVLRSLEGEHATSFIRLRFEQGALVGAALGRHALVALAPTASDADLVGPVQEVRAILAQHDFSTVPEHVPPSPRAHPSTPGGVSATMPGTAPDVTTRRRARALIPSRGGTPRRSLRR